MSVVCLTGSLEVGACNINKQCQMSSENAVAGPCCPPFARLSGQERQLVPARRLLSLLLAPTSGKQTGSPEQVVGCLQCCMV